MPYNQNEPALTLEPWQYCTIETFVLACSKAVEPLLNPQIFPVAFLRLPLGG